MSSQKSELPTPKRLRDARKKGQVCHSKDLSSAALLAATLAAIGFNWHWTRNVLQEMIVLPASFFNQPFEEALPAVAAGIAMKCVLIVLPVLGSVIVVGVAANYFQTGPLFAPQSLKPDLNRLNPGQKLKQMFSVKNLMELLKTILKIAILGYLVYTAIKGTIPAMLTLPYSGLPGVLTVLDAMLYQIAVLVVLAYATVAAADFFFQRQQYIKGLRMSKDEVKQEYKEMEGDPLIKSRRRHLHQELAQNNAIERVKKSTVLVTNPTHLAVAVYYNREETDLPVVYAKGEGWLAQRMVEAAKEAGVPIMQNVPLAHDLFDHGNLDQYIPSDLIEPVAEVLRWVQQVKQQAEQETE